MATQNPSGLYTSANVVLDSTPYARIAAQNKLKSKALNEATYRHYSELPDKLNMAGVRQQDLQDPKGNGGINNDLVGIREFWDVNKNDIMRGGRAQQEYAQKIQRTSQRIEESKQKAKTQMEIGKSFFDNKFEPDDDDVKVMQAMDESIYSPSHYKDPLTKMPYSITDLSASAPAYTVQKQQQFEKAYMNNIKPTKLLDNPEVDEKGFRVGFETKYDTKNIEMAANNAGTMASLDKSIKRANRQLLKDPQKVEEASNGLSYLAEGEVIPTTPEQMAAGLAAYKLMNFKGKEWSNDKSQIEAAKNYLLEKRQRFQAAENAKKEAGKDKRTNLLIDGIEYIDPYKKAVSDAVTVAVFNPEKSGQFASQRVYDTKRFIPFEGMNQEHYNALSNNGQIPGSQANVNGKLKIGYFVEKNDKGEDVLMGGNGMVIDKVKPMAKIYSEGKGVSKAIQKGELENPLTSPKATAPKKAEGRFNKNKKQ